jgi:hypothetical protein
MSNKTAVKSRISTTNRTCRWHKHHRKNKKSYSEVYIELKERAKEVELSTTVERKNQWHKTGIQEDEVKC